MKTTIDIADDLLERARRVAAERRVTLKSLAEEGLRLVLDRAAEGKEVKIEPVVVGGNGLRAGLPEDFIDNVRDWAYEDEPRR
jgi:hypothetical protein